MMKRIISLLLCLFMIGSVFAGCSSGPDDEDKGAYINMYLTDMVYDLDPANAFANESALKIVSLLYENLFYLDAKGNLKKELASKYVITEDEKTNEYSMIITLGEGTWSDGIAVTANDVVYAWKRVLDNENSFAAASLLFDIKNARAAKYGDASIDDVALYALNEKEVYIQFEEKIDYDQFLLNISSYALVPLREEVVLRNGADWAKKPATIVTSGPFKLRVARYDTTTKSDGSIALKEMVIERNTYYHRDPLEDAHDKAVTPYRLNINYDMTDEEIKAAYDEGTLFYIGNSPLSLRETFKDDAKVTDALSTNSLVLNQNAEIGGQNLFAKKEVRQALSLAIDREAVANAVVFAKAATGLVPYGVFNANSAKKQFREVGGDVIASSADIDAAKALLSSAGIKASDYSFSISVAAYDDVHMAIAEMIKDAWNSLGFKVSVKAIDVIANDDYYKPTESTPTDIKDDLFMEAYQGGDFEVVLVDLCAYSVDAFSVLSVYAKAFSGEGMDMSTFDYELTPHITGFDNEAYNELIEKAFDEKNIEKRAEILHEAEEMLLDEMVVIPVVFNENAVLIKKDLSNVQFSYFGTPRFKKTKLKNYKKYVPVEE